MKTILFVAVATLSLAACNSEPAEAPAEDAAATEAPAEVVSAMVGVYEEQTDDGQTLTTNINADGTYSEVVGGEVTEVGTWSETEGPICFTPDGDGAETRCFTTTAPDENGVFEATLVDGSMSVTVTKVG